MFPSPTIDLLGTTPATQGDATTLLRDTEAATRGVPAGDPEAACERTHTSPRTLSAGLPPSDRTPGQSLPDYARHSCEVGQAACDSTSQPEADTAGTDFVRTWLPLSRIASQLGLTKYEAGKLADRAGWISRTVGNRREYQAPGFDSPAVAPSVRFADLRDGRARQKVLARESAVRQFMALVEAGAGVCRAAEHVVNTAKRAFSYDTLRRWWRAYEAHGLDGLVEQRDGNHRVTVASLIPEHILAQARAAAVEHGTLGLRGAQNIARAVRNVIHTHPDLPADARLAMHTTHASKSTVPPSVRRALTVSPQARDLIQGPHAERLNAPFTPGDWSDVPAGRILTGDDMTANAYCWCEAPGQLGYAVMRPQIIAFLDCGSLRFVGATAVMRQAGANKGSYNTDDVWGGLGDVLGTHGVWPEVLFEGGDIWQGSRMLGVRTGLSNDERWGGLRSLGVRVRHSRHPRSKPIEERFNQLQYQADTIAGACGRREREDKPEAIAAVLAAVKSGRLHPRQAGLPHISEYRRHLQAAMESLNLERNDGKVLRGQAPDEKWAVDAPIMRQLDATASWMFRSSMRVVTVLRNGMLHLTEGSGKFRVDLYFRNPEVLVPLAGQRVIVYYNTHDSTADAVVLRATDKSFAGLVQYVEPLSRFDATRAAMSADARAKAEYHAFARQEVASIRPHLHTLSTPTTSLPGRVADRTATRQAVSDRTSETVPAIVRGAVGPQVEARFPAPMDSADGDNHGASATRPGHGSTPTTQQQVADGLAEGERRAGQRERARRVDVADILRRRADQIADDEW